MRRLLAGLVSFYRKAYRDNLTGFSAMVAYNLLLSLLPLALVALFVAGRVLSSGELEESVLRDLQKLFPSEAASTIHGVLERVKSGSTGFGLVGLLASIWVGASFWGALDTAFCRIYDARCRSWVEQKRFALGMLVVSLLLMAATVVVPAAQSILVRGAKGLPFGLAHQRALVYSLTLASGLVILFLLLCLIYWAVPSRAVSWREVWPGAFTATLAMGAIGYAFPLYLTNVSTVAHLGTTLVLIVIILLWFYALALIMLAGAIINALRCESRAVSPAHGQEPGDPGSVV